MFERPIKSALETPTAIPCPPLAGVGGLHRTRFQKQKNKQQKSDSKNFSRCLSFSRQSMIFLALIPVMNYFRNSFSKEDSNMTVLKCCTVSCVSFTAYSPQISGVLLLVSQPRRAPNE
jgi:hypothetical protein